jgi:cytochrome c-type biogenesis protein
VHHNGAVAPTAAVAATALAQFSRFDDVSPLAYLVAFGGGIVSFLSPCVLPMVPAYLSLVTGLDVATIQDGRREHMAAIARTTGLFIAGFGTVFVVLGLTATSVSAALFRNQETLTRVSGALLLAMALFLAGSLVLQAPWLYQERRFHPRLGRFGAAAPLVAGAAFGFGWTPCIGPVLGSILGIAASTGRMWAGATLLATYTIGLGVPFLVSGLALGRLQGTFGLVKRHFPLVVGTSAAVLGVFGALLVLDSLTTLTTELQQVLERVGLDLVFNV